MRFATKYVKYAAFLFLILALVSCSRKKKTPPGGGNSQDPSSPSVVSLSIIPQEVEIAKETTYQYAAIGTLSDNTTQDMTALVVWSSLSTDVATVNSSGLASAVTPGTAIIKASSGSVETSTTLTVLDITLESISVTPETTANPSLIVGLTKQFKATGIFNNGSSQDVTTQVTWSSSDTAIATVDTKGLVKGIAGGTTTITATILSASGATTSGSTKLTVIGVTLSSITVTPVKPSIVIGTTQQFTATGKYSNGSTEDITSSVTWSSLDTSRATIDSTGLATGVAAGSVTIKAASGTKSGFTFLTVTSAAISSIVVTSPNTSVTIGTIEPFTATGIFDNGTSQDITSIAEWSSSNPNVPINNSGENKGKATANAEGSTSITATFSGKSGSKTLTVLSGTLTSIAITPSVSSIAGGTTKQFAADGTYSSGIIRPLTSSDITWSSSLSGFATIDPSTGLATAVSPGTTTITATQSSNCSGESCVKGTASLTVTSAVLSSISVTPILPSTPTGGTRQFTATGIFDDGSSQDLTTSVTWSSSIPSRATIDSTGLAIGLAPGTTTIKAERDGMSGQTTLTVTSATLNAISISPRDAFMVSGTLLQFTATGTFTDGSTQDITDLATWASSSGIVLVDNTGDDRGLALAASPGNTTISASYSGGSALTKSDSTGLTVTNAVIQSILVTPTNPSIPKGIPQQFTATGIFDDGSAQNITSSVTWTTSNSGIATINNSGDDKGLAMAVSPGDVTITAVFSGIPGIANLNVNGADLASVSITPANSSIGISTTQQFTATANFDNSPSFDVTSLATWASSNSVVATITGTGLATGVGLGTTTITADFGGITGLTSFEIKKIFLTSIAIAPSAPSVPVGGVQPLLAIGTFEPGPSTQDLTSSVSWSSKQAGVATVSNTPGTQGFASGVSEGSTIITATFFGETTISGTTTLTVGGANPAQITAGKNHTCTRLTNGEVRCWGGNFLGQMGNNSTINSSLPLPIDGKLTTVFVATGELHTCAILDNGTVRCWGSNSSGQLGDGSSPDQNPHAIPIQVSNLLSVVGVAGGAAHTCAVQESGAVRCWGENGSGQLGNNSTTDSTVPVSLGTLGATAVVTGANHSCALILGGSVRCWGENGSGQLGIGTTDDSLTPASTGITNATAIAAGENHTCAILSDEKVKCWGANGSGQLGNGTTANSSSPVLISGLSGATTIAAGGSHTCVSVATGGVQCWGENGSGQVGDDTITDTPSPVSVVGISTAASISAGGKHSCVLLSGSEVKCWGSNVFGQLGDGSDPISPLPIHVPGMENATTLGLGKIHTCARISDGTVKCMGDNQFGQLGNGTTTGTDIPVDTGVSGASSVAAGDFHTCAITSGDAVKCWGANNTGQLGDGTNTDALSPVDIGVTATAIAAGSGFTCAIISGGSVQCWGTNGTGQLGNNDIGHDSTTPVSVSIITNATSISAGIAHVCALLLDSTVMCWGDDLNGQLGDGLTATSPIPVFVKGTDGSNLSGVIGIAAGGNHTCAVISGGTVQCWGANGSGQLGNNTTAGPEDASPIPGPVFEMSTAANISVNGFHSCARTTSNTLFCWGEDGFGQLGNNSAPDDSNVPVGVTSGISDITAIATGENHTCARVSTGGGNVKCWGLGSSGQIGSDLVLVLIEKTPVLVLGI